MEIYKPVYTLIANNMLKRRLALSLLLVPFLITTGSAANSTLLNGTHIYLATGDSYGLYQGYILNLKSVGSDGSIWLQLNQKEQTVKSDVVRNYDYFTYNKTNKTIISIKVDNIYSGSSEQSLVSLYLYQFIDPSMPAPNQTEIVPVQTRNPDNNISLPRIRTPQEPYIWALGILLVLALFYMVRKLW
ncbi:S-layer protein [uncultured archaeon]|nr:S-layer protein [uncultured archaeon]